MASSLESTARWTGSRRVPTQTRGASATVERRRAEGSASTTGLNRAFSCAALYVPAITDTMGYRKGRQSGWPQPVERNAQEARETVEKWAPYFDAANFASRIRCPVRVAVGFSDPTCPPCAVYAAYNEIEGRGQGHRARHRDDAQLPWQILRTVRKLDKGDDEMTELSECYVIDSLENIGKYAARRELQEGVRLHREGRFRKPCAGTERD